MQAAQNQPARAPLYNTEVNEAICAANRFD
jgi:hypothetical protein